MKKVLILFGLLTLFIFGCTQTTEQKKVDPTDESQTYPSETEVDDTKIEPNTFNVTINNITYSAEFSDNQTAKEFSKLLPLSCEMTELNRNEKYYRLPEKLTSTNEYSGKIQNGDIMLYQDNTIVLFYEDFDTTYSYTPIGKITDPSGLKEQVGDGNIEVTFN